MCSVEMRSDLCAEKFNSVLLILLHEVYVRLGKSCGKGADSLRAHVDRLAGISFGQLVSLCRGQCGWKDSFNESITLREQSSGDGTE